MSRPRFIALLLALITLVVYLPVTQEGFLGYDDDVYVTDNQFVEAGFTVAGLKWAFTTFHAGNWHPVTWLSHMADCQFFKLNAGAHHFVNALFHSINTALLFILLWQLTQKMLPAVFVAALFAWHPLHVESVAWVSERKDLLSTFFALLTLLCHVKYTERSKAQSPKAKVSQGLSLLFFALSLMAKPMFVTLPFVLLLLDFWPLRRFSPGSFRWPLVLEKAPFFLIAAGSCVITCFAQQTAMSSLKAVSLPYRLENAAVAPVHYLLAIFWPANLAVIYPLASIPIWAVLAAVVVLALVSIAAWQASRSSPFLLMGWLWFLGTLVPVLGLVQVGVAARADRYCYFPAVGIFIAVAFGLQELIERRPGLKTAVRTGMILCLAGCVTMTEWQLRYWRDGEALFRHAVAVTPNNEIAHLNLGVALEKKGRFADGLVEYRKALSLGPYLQEVHFSIGNMLEKLGRPAEALDEYHQCLLLKPKNAALHNAIGRSLAAQGMTAEALAELAEAGQLDARFAAPHLETAKILFQEGRDAEAVTELQAGTRAEPRSPAILTMVARYLAANQDSAARDGQTALALALQANDLSGGSEPETLDVLGMAFAETGDFTNALACAQNALSLSDASDPESTGLIRVRIADYQNHLPWRESFAATNRPAKN